MCIKNTHFKCLKSYYRISRVEVTHLFLECTHRSHIIVYYVPRRTMRVIARRATMATNHVSVAMGQVATTSLPHYSHFFSNYIIPSHYDIQHTSSSPSMSDILQ